MGVIFDNVNPGSLETLLPCVPQIDPAICVPPPTRFPGKPGTVSGPTSAMPRQSSLLLRHQAYL